MTKKHNPLENPPAASSSDDEEEVDSSAGEEEEVNDSSSSSEEEDQPKPPSSSAVTIAIPGKTTSPSDSDSGSETETDSESKKDKSRPPATKSGTKRLSEVTSNEKTNSKRAKKDEDSKKPVAFHRLWTEEDEIAVLQGMIDFKKDTGNSPYDDTNAYYDYIKKSISFEVSKNQFMDKLRGLKKKYMGKEKPSFTRPHEQKSYRLCKYIWGPDGMGLESAVKSNGGVSKKKTKKVDSVKKELSFAVSASPNGKAVEDGSDDKRVLAHEYDWFEKSFLVRGIAGLGTDEHYVKQRWRLVPAETKKKVEEKVKMLQAKEIEFVLQKTEILREVTSMMAEASKKKSH